MSATPKYSIIIPVYNRPHEVEELLESLKDQSYKDFEVMIIEDGSTEPCDQVVQRYENKLNIKYHYKQNSGPGDSRNTGMSKASGQYLIFFDSDCIIPPDYFEKVNNHLAIHQLDAFGGPDNAHPLFSHFQKAVNHAMTSIITTGGIRGKKTNLDKFQPRSFNMGIKKEVYKKAGGFSDIHPGEDPDLSYRIMNAGFTTGLIENAFVYHKRRINFSKFIKQVYKFGIVRPILIKWYPDKFRITYLLPSFFLLFSICSVVLSWIISPVFIAPLPFIILVIFIEAIIKTKSLTISFLATIASLTQLYGYGYGFLKSAIQIHLFKRNERKAFPGFFFKTS